MTYNLADAFDLIAATCPEREALVQGGQHLTWQTLERRARNISAWMLAQGRVAAGQGGDLHVQPSRLHGGRVRGDEGGAGAGQRQLSLPRGGAALPARQRRRRDRHRARGVRAADGQGGAASAAACAACWSSATTARQAIDCRAARTPRATRRLPSTDAACAAASRAPPTTISSSTPAARPACRRASCGARPISTCVWPGGGLMPPPTDARRAARAGAQPADADARR